MVNEVLFALIRSREVHDTPLSDSLKKEMLLAIERGANVNALTQFTAQQTAETALHYAVRCADLSLMDFLLEQAADPNAVNMAFETPLAYIVDRPVDDKIKQSVFKKLLTSRQRYPLSRLDTSLEICDEHCQFTSLDSADAAVTTTSHELIAFFVSQMTGFDVAKLWHQNGNANTYAMQIRHTLDLLRSSEQIQVAQQEGRWGTCVTVSGGGVTTVSTRIGWYAEQFLPLRIHLLMEMLVAMRQQLGSRSVEKEMEKDGIQEHIKKVMQETLGHEIPIAYSGASLLPEDQKKLDYLKHEIVIALETLRIVMERKAILQLSDLYTRKTLYECLAKKVLGFAAQLAEGETYCLPIGWRAHEMYLTLVCNESGEIVGHINNVGQFSNENNHHAMTPQGGIYPRTIFKLAQAQVANNAVLQQYVSELLRVKNEENDVNVAKQSIYLRVFNADEPFIKPNKALDEKGVLSNLQLVGNCVYVSYNIGTQIRAQQQVNEAFYRWCLMQEKRFLAPKENEDHYIKTANISSYWQARYDEFNTAQSERLVEYVDVDRFMLGRISLPLENTGYTIVSNSLFFSDIHKALQACLEYQYPRYLQNAVAFCQQTIEEATKGRGLILCLKPHQIVYNDDWFHPDDVESVRRLMVPLTQIVNEQPVSRHNAIEYQNVCQQLLAKYKQQPVSEHGKLLEDKLKAWPRYISFEEAKRPMSTFLEALVAKLETLIQADSGIAFVERSCLILLQIQVLRGIRFATGESSTLEKARDKIKSINFEGQPKALIYLRIAFLFQQGLVHAELQEIQQAKECFLECLQRYEQVNYQSKFFRGSAIFPERGKIQLALGFIALELNELELALDCFESAELTTMQIINNQDYSQHFSALRFYGLGIVHKRFSMKDNARFSTQEQDKTLSLQYFDQAKPYGPTLYSVQVDTHVQELCRYFNRLEKRQNKFVLGNLLTVRKRMQESKNSCVSKRSQASVDCADETTEESENKRARI